MISGTTAGSSSDPNNSGMATGLTIAIVMASKPVTNKMLRVVRAANRVDSSRGRLIRSWSVTCPRDESRTQTFSAMLEAREYCPTAAAPVNRFRTNTSARSHSWPLSEPG